MSKARLSKLPSKKKKNDVSLVHDIGHVKPKFHLSVLAKAVLTVLLSTLLIYGVAQAGSLTPSLSPAATMNSLADLAGSGFVTATHSLKAIYDKVNSLVTDVWDKSTSQLTTSSSIGKLITDNLNATISSRSSHSAADVWTSGTRTLTSFGTMVGDIWDKATSELSTPGSVGKLLVDNVDTTISSRLAAASYVTERGTDNAALASDYTSARAGYLDTLKTGPKGVTAISAENANYLTNANASKYCYDLSAAAAAAMDGDTSTVYTDWRLPTYNEAILFAVTINDDSYLATSTITFYTGNVHYATSVKLDNGYTSYYYANNGINYVRCVR